MKGQRGVYHTVKKSETFWRICKTYGVPMQDVAEANNIRNVAKIRIGQRLFIPGRTRLRKVIPYLPVKGEKIKKVVVRKGRFAWPIRGKILSKYGPRGGSMHNGLDIKANKGKPVKASDSGMVVYSGNGMRGYGNVIIIEHKEDFFTVYAHNRKNHTKKGRRVEKGQVIAEIGDTGNATTPHLHFEVRQGKKTRNPLFFLP